MNIKDDVMLIDISKEGVEGKLKLWMNTLEAQGLRISRTKTKYMKCDFRGTAMREDLFIHLNNHELPQKRHFKYFSSMLDADGDINEDAKYKIAVGWLKWRAISRVLNDKQVLTKLKGKFYITIILSALIYRIKCWTTKQIHIDKIRAAKIRTCENTLKDQHISTTKGGTNQGENERTQVPLVWAFVQRCPSKAIVKIYIMLFCHCIKSGRGKPKRTWIDTIRKGYGTIGAKH